MKLFSSKLVATAAFAVGMTLAAAPAHALVIAPFTSPAGPYNLGNPNGTVAAIHLFQNNTYNFTFTTTGTFDVLMQLQASMFRPFQPQPLTFSLYSGLPGSGVLLTTSGP